jgi:hypothetical protein
LKQEIRETFLKTLKQSKRKNLLLENWVGSRLKVIKLNEVDIKNAASAAFFDSDYFSSHIRMDVYF